LKLKAALSIFKEDPNENERENECFDLLTPAAVRNCNLNRRANGHSTGSNSLSDAADRNAAGADGISDAPNGDTTGPDGISNTSDRNAAGPEHHAHAAECEPQYSAVRSDDEWQCHINYSHDKQHRYRAKQFFHYCRRYVPDDEFDEHYREQLLKHARKFHRFYDKQSNWDHFDQFYAGTVELSPVSCAFAANATARNWNAEDARVMDFIPRFSIPRLKESAWQEKIPQYLESTPR
jgi:hypothetical protein